MLKDQLREISSGTQAQFEHFMDLVVQVWKKNYFFLVFLKTTYLIN